MQRIEAEPQAKAQQAKEAEEAEEAEESKAQKAVVTVAAEAAVAEKEKEVRALKARPIYRRPWFWGMIRDSKKKRWICSGAPSGRRRGRSVQK